MGRRAAPVRDRSRLPDALPFRPVRGIHFTLSHFAAKDSEAHDIFAWYDRVRIPKRITMLYLDEDPIDALDDIQAKEAGWRAAGRSRDTSGAEDIRYASPFRTIVPWEWDWFDTK